MLSRKSFAVAASAGLLALGVAACGDDSSDDTSSSASGGDLSGNLAGAGSSAQDAAQQAWIAGFQEANPDVTIAYDPIGSGGGREQFIAGGKTAFAGSDAALEGSELTGAQDRCKTEGGELVQIPTYISAIAVVYNLPEVPDLQLSPETIAGIFNQDITTWNDPAIASDNPDADLPDTDITPVNRSDESGTTENFADYLSQTAPDTWTYPVDGNWPVKGGEAANGTSGVVEAVSAGEGTIGYADESQATDLGIAKVKIGDEYVAPSPEGAANIIDKSKETKEGNFVFSYEINRTTDDPSTYPVVLASYGIACTAYEDTSTGELVGGYFDYMISPEGQDAAASNAGSSPITDATREQIQPAVEAIGS